MGLCGSGGHYIIGRKGMVYIMDIIERIAGALKTHPLVTGAGLCVSPEGMGDAESDVDIFVYCSDIPSENERAALVSNIADDYTPGTRQTRWGICDATHSGGEEVWLMYVTQARTMAEAEDILAGRLPGRTDNYYYPVGRLATLKNLRILFDKNGFLLRLKARLGEYPEELSKTLIKFHSEALQDTEDLERAAARGDVMFYHFALDLSLDCFLQALFAMNREYFPSRKRSLMYISGFDIKPAGCEETLLRVLKLGGSPEGTRASFDAMAGLIAWTRQQADAML
jgi:hypothetical protein